MLDPSPDTRYWLLRYTSTKPGFARFSLWREPWEFLRYQRQHDTLVVGHLGLLAFAFALNLFAFSVSRRRAYAYYASFLLFHALSTIGYEGLVFGFGWPHLHQLLMLSIPLSVLFVLQFSTHYLALATEAPRWLRVLRGFQLACVLLLAQALTVEPAPEEWLLAAAHPDSVDMILRNLVRQAAGDGPHAFKSLRHPLAAGPTRSNLFPTRWRRARPHRAVPTLRRPRFCPRQSAPSC